MKKQFTIFLILFFVLGLVPINFSSAQDLSNRLSGRILLQVESVGQAWYIDPGTKERAFLGRPADAFRIMRELGLGISEKDYNSFNGYAPSRLSGKILLRVEANGEAYYVFPGDLKMYYLGRPADAFDIMRKQGLGITDEDLAQVPIFQKYAEQTEANTNEINLLNEKIDEQQNKINELEEKINTDTSTSTDSCIADTWICGTWDECSSGGQQTRACNLTFDCQNADTPSPAITQNCSPASSSTPIDITLGDIKIGSYTAHIAWNTNLPTNSKLFLTKSGGSTQVISSISGYSTKHIVDISSLIYSTQYLYTIEVTAGTQSKQKNGSFITLPQPKELKITMSNNSVPISGYDIIDGRAEYFVDGKLKTGSCNNISIVTDDPVQDINFQNYGGCYKYFSYIPKTLGAHILEITIDDLAATTTVYGTEFTEVKPWITFTQVEDYFSKGIDNSYSSKLAASNFGGLDNESVLIEQLEYEIVSDDFKEGELIIIFHGTSQEGITRSFYTASGHVKFSYQSLILKKDDTRGLSIFIDVPTKSGSFKLIINSISARGYKSGNMKELLQSPAIFDVTIQ